jgi:arylsulfatase A-like enzyme
VTASGVLLISALAVRAEWRERGEEARWAASLPPAAEGAPNILLVILDTVRGASLSFLEGWGPLSDGPVVSPPTLSALAGASVVFEKATVSSPWTLPSHASMFTGRWPNRLSAGGVLSLGWMGALGPEYPTVAEVLRRNGYFTAGFVGNLVYTSSETGLDRGFIRYEDYQVTPGQVLLSCALGRRFAANRVWRRLVGFHDTLNRKDADTVADQFLAWHREAGDRPYFAFLNFFDAHEPYFPPDSVRRSLPSGEEWNDFSHAVGLLTGAAAWRTDKWTMTPAERGAHAAGYLEGILKADRALGRILDALEDREGLENTVVIVTSDHGEQLGEHSLFNHNNSLYMPLLHVPLLVRDPREAPVRERVDQVVSLRNLAATVLDLAGVSSSGGIQGQSLGRFWREGDEEGSGEPALWAADTAFATLNRGTVERPWYPVGWGATMFSLVDSVHHYVLNGDGTEELYDLETDPGEEVDLARDPARRDSLERLRALIRSLASNLPPFVEGPAEHPRPPGG